MLITMKLGAGKTALAKFIRRAEAARPELIVATGANAYTGAGHCICPARDLRLLTGDVEFDWSGGMLTEERTGRQCRRRRADFAG
ncbi:MAG: hypothetical protein U1F68_00205 [Gammaproteobacteria bacterium]